MHLDQQEREIQKALDSRARMAQLDAERRAERARYNGIIARLRRSMTTRQLAARLGYASENSIRKRTAAF